MSMKVLIAETDWRFSRQAAAYLESLAHLTIQENNARAALERARSWQPDLVIVSEELTQDGMLESLQSLPSAPAVLLVGWMDRCGQAWRAWQRGGHDLLIKPIFRADELHAAVVAALENAAAGTRTSRAASA